jgi:uncharacterized membrane protein
MKIQQKSLRHGIAWALLVALIGSIVPTFIDWRLNPGGIFRGSEGTNWGVVVETIWTWFWPLFLVIVPIAVLLYAWLEHRKKKREVED